MPDTFLMSQVAWRMCHRAGVEDLSEDSDAGIGHDDKNPPSSPGNTEANRRGRRAFPAHLKRERILHDLDEAEKHCNTCAQDLREFGEETSERYENDARWNPWTRNAVHGILKICSRLPLKMPPASDALTPIS